MPLNWDDDEEELTELEYRKKPSRIVIHEEVTEPMKDAAKPPVPSYPATPEPRPSPEIIAPPRTTAPHGFQPASPRDRFAAFFIDSVVGFYTYWLLGYFLNIFFGTPNLKALHESSGRWGIHLSLTLLVFFFYYLLMESVLGATLGKFFCRLRVIEENGLRPSLGNVFIRNFLRVVDYPLAFLIAVISMESSPLKQRLGDRAAKTVVIKKTRGYLPAVDLKSTPLASTLSRIFAELFDLFFALLLVYSVVLLMREGKPLLSYVLLISTPLIFIAYYTAVEFISGTTPGKMLFGRRVVMENGEPPDGTSALMRNLFRPLDYLLGYPFLVLSKKNQRLGDLAADTLVVVKSAGAKGLWTSLAAISLVFMIAYFGFTNSQSLIRTEYGLGPWQGYKIFIPQVRKKLRTPAKGVPSGTPSPSTPIKTGNAKIPGSPLPPSTSDKLKLSEFYFATGPEPTQIRHDRKFRQGDLIYIFFKIEGFQLNEQMETSLSEALTIEDPQGNKIISDSKIVELNKKISEGSKGILFANNIKLPKDPPKGKYRAVFTVYDHVAGGQFSFEKTFEMQ